MYNFATIKQVISACSTCSRVVRQEPFARTAHTHCIPTTSCTLQTCASIAHCRVRQPSRPGCDTHIPSHCLRSTSIDMTSGSSTHTVGLCLWYAIGCLCLLNSLRRQRVLATARRSHDPPRGLEYGQALTTSKPLLRPRLEYGQAKAPLCTTHFLLPSSVSARHGLRAQGIAACT